MKASHRYIKCCVFLGLMCGYAASTFAQLNNTALSDEININPNDSGKIGLSVSSFNYLRNTEYFNNMEFGRTLFGTQLNPRLTYQPNGQTTLQAGVFLQQDFGAIPSLTRVLPTFSVKLKSKNYKRTFIFGTLEGALAHQLIEPLFDINAAILRRIENGAQFKINTKNIWLDTWINWERFIERGSPYKEQFTAGINTHAVLYQTKTNDTKALNANGIEVAQQQTHHLLKPIFQFTAHHRGGQIDKDTSNMVMQFNGAAGLSYQLITPNQLSIKAEAYGVFYKENTNSGFYPYRKGNGLFAHVSMTKKAFTFAPSFWRGKGFIADRGTSIYQSVSVDKPGYTEKMRNLLFLRMFYTQKLAPDLLLNVRFEPFLDMRSKAMDYSYSVYLSYRLNKTLSR
jgi:hypothetical protein